MNEEKDDESPPTSLDYRSSRDEVESGQILGQAIGGCILVGLQTIVSVFLVCLAFVAHAIVGFPVLAIALYWMAIVVDYGICNRNDPDKKGWVIGIWLGIGVGLLVEGICFASLTRM